MAKYSLFIHQKNVAVVSGWQLFTATFDTVLQGNATKQLHAFSTGMIPAAVQVINSKESLN